MPFSVETEAGGNYDVILTDGGSLTLLTSPATPAALQAILQNRVQQSQTASSIASGALVVPALTLTTVGPSGKVLVSFACAYQIGGTTGAGYQIVGSLQVGAGTPSQIFAAPDITSAAGNEFHSFAMLQEVDTGAAAGTALVLRVALLGTAPGPILLVNAGPEPGANLYMAEQP